MGLLSLIHILLKAQIKVWLVQNSLCLLLRQSEFTLTFENGHYFTVYLKVYSTQMSGTFLFVPTFSTPIYGKVIHLIFILKKFGISFNFRLRRLFCFSICSLQLFKEKAKLDALVPTELLCSFLL